jgi:tetratricopeptide (TPR) repeat protein
LLVEQSNPSIINGAYQGRQTVRDFLFSHGAAAIRKRNNQTTFYDPAKERTMSATRSTDETLTQRYITAIDELSEIARVYHRSGRTEDALQLLATSLRLADAGEVGTQSRLKLLLLRSEILIVDHLLRNTENGQMFATIQQAKQLAETTEDQQGIADALSLLGQAHYFADLNTGSSPNSTQEEGRYRDALAFQQQALKLREGLHDTRGMSESYFLIGIVYERWQQHDTAQEYYIQALQIADQYGHDKEKAEPYRHRAWNAFLVTKNLDQALVYASQALSLREAASFKPYQPLDHILLSDIYLKKQDTASAQLHAQQALVLAEEMGYKRTLSQCQLTLGDIHLAQQEEEQARASYEKALALAQEVQIPLSVARAKERLTHIPR